MKVCIDPGHGMSNRTSGVYDPGATHTEGATRHQEADIALLYGLALKDVLRARTIPVFMTRDDATDAAPVGHRAAEAAAAGCTLFISFHLNDFEDDAANGTETLYRSAGNLGFAQQIQSAVLGTLGLRDRGCKERTDLAVLRFNGPAALIELGFITNDGDRARVMSPAARVATCEAIADQIDRIRKVASSQLAQMDPEADERSEADDDSTGESHYDPAAAAFASAAPQNRAAFVAAFGETGARTNFDHQEFSDLIASWGVRHFTSMEFLRFGASHEGNGGCAGKNSLPPKTLWPNLRKTALLADAIRQEFGRPIIVLSAYRDADYNACIGGASASHHLRFNALDLANVGGTTARMHQIAERLMRTEPDFAGGLGLYAARGFIHIDTRGTFTPF